MRRDIQRSSLRQRWSSRNRQGKAERWTTNSRASKPCQALTASATRRNTGHLLRQRVLRALESVEYPAGFVWVEALARFAFSQIAARSTAASHINSNGLALELTTDPLRFFNLHLRTVCASAGNAAADGALRVPFFASLKSLEGNRSGCRAQSEDLRMLSLKRRFSFLTCIERIQSRGLLVKT